jgi:hypothetical protein
MISNKTVKKVYINTTKKDGSPLVDKNGNPYKLIALETTDGTKASMFCGKFGQKDLEVIQTWQEGQAVIISLEKNGDFLNFSLPTKTDELEARVAVLEDMMSKMTRPSGMVDVAIEQGASVEDVDVSQIPF